MTDGVLSTQPELANLDIWFATAADANTYWDWVVFGRNTGNDDDVRAAYQAAKGQAKGGHFATITNMPASPGGVGLRRFTDGGMMLPDSLRNDQQGEAGGARDTMSVVVT